MKFKIGQIVNVPTDIKAIGVAKIFGYDEQGRSDANLGPFRFPKTYILDSLEAFSEEKIEVIESLLEKWQKTESTLNWMKQL